MGLWADYYYYCYSSPYFGEATAAAAFPFIYLLPSNFPPLFCFLSRCKAHFTYLRVFYLAYRNLMPRIFLSHPPSFDRWSQRLGGKKLLCKKPFRLIQRFYFFARRKYGNLSSASQDISAICFSSILLVIIWHWGKFLHWPVCCASSYFVRGIIHAFLNNLLLKL